MAHRGMLGMANLAPCRLGTQFYIECISTSKLTYRYVNILRYMLVWCMGLCIRSWSMLTKRFGGTKRSPFFFCSRIWNKDSPVLIPSFLAFHHLSMFMELEIKLWHSSWPILCLIDSDYCKWELVEVLENYSVLMEVRSCFFWNVNLIIIKHCYGLYCWCRWYTTTIQIRCVWLTSL